MQEVNKIEAVNPDGKPFPLEVRAALREVFSWAATEHEGIPDLWELDHPSHAFPLLKGILRSAQAYPEAPIPPFMVGRIVAAILLCLQTTDSAEAVRMHGLLVAKNEAYGDSALSPIRVFSSLGWEEAVLCRIDDKISRLLRGKEYPGDDTLRDLLGYIVLLQVGRARADRARVKIMICEVSPIPIQRVFDQIDTSKIDL